MTTYPLTQSGSLLYTNAALKGKNGVFHIRLLVDTGSTYTIMPWGHLAMSGLEPSLKVDSVQITAASGTIIAPRVRADWFSCCGLLLKSFPVIAHTLPSGLSSIGILGMDFLRAAKSQIDVFNSQLSTR